MRSSGVLDTMAWELDELGIQIPPFDGDAPPGARFTAQPASLAIPKSHSETPKRLQKKGMWAFSSPSRLG